MADGQDVVAALQSGLGRHFVGTQYQQAVFVARDLFGQRQSDVVEGKTLVLQIGTVIAAGMAASAAVVFIGIVEQDFLFDDFAVAPDLERNFLAGGNGADHDGQVVGGAHFFAVHAEDDVALLQTGLCRRTVGHHLGNQRAHRFAEAERFGQVVIDFLNDDAQPSALHFTRGAELVGHIHGDVNRNGEGNAHKAAAAAVNLGVDADHLSV